MKVTPLQSDTDRIDRLEFTASEEERKRRSIEVTIKHPSFDKVDGDLNARGKELPVTVTKGECLLIIGALRETILGLETGISPRGWWNEK